MVAESKPTAVAKATVNTIQAFMESRRDLIAQVAPKHLNPDRLIKVALLARGKDSKIAACSPESLLKCVLQAAELGLEAGGPQGHAYLVPYGKELTLVVGYRGMLELVRRSGMVQRIEAHLIHANDKYRVKFGLDPILEHEPALTGDPGPVVAAYAVAIMKDGSSVMEVMTIAQLEAIKKRSRASSNGPWVTDTEEMYRKTVMRRLCKFLPQSPELVRIAEVEDDGHQGPTIDVVASNEESPAPATKTAALKVKVKGALGPKVQRETAPEPGAEEQEAILAQEAEADAADQEKAEVAAEEPIPF